jgi:hypothetical protein
MAHINPNPPVVGADTGVWGDKLNAENSTQSAAINSLDDRATALENTALTTNGRVTALEVGSVSKPVGGTDGQPLVKNGNQLAWGAPTNVFSVVDNGNGTFSISGTGVTDNGDGTYTVTY